MACRASGGRGVTLGEHSGMHTLLVVRHLIGGNFGVLHVGGVRVTARASGGYVGGVNRRTRIGNSQDIVNPVTVHASSDLGIALAQPFAVHAGEVLGQLVSAHFGIEAVHVSDVGMTAGAEIRDEAFLGNAVKSLGPAHGVHGCRSEEHTSEL